MSDDYLWDRTGSDPEVERLERALKPLGHDPAKAPPPLPRRRRRGLLLALPLAAAAAAVALFALRPPAEEPVRNLASAHAGPSEPSEYVLQIDVASAGRTDFVGEGEWVAGTESERVIRLGAAGEVRAEAGARVRVVRIREDENRLHLERGTVHARIGAHVRPRFFQVETPATNCVDLGCVYTLSVDDAGKSLVRVDYGRVAFEDGKREVFVPAGAECVAEKGTGAGTPLFRDASAEFAAAVAAFDAARGDGRRAAASDLAAKAGRPRETLSLWHLLQDADREVRAAALAGILRHEAAPEAAKAEAVLAGEKAAVDAWRDALERHWF